MTLSHHLVSCAHSQIDNPTPGHEAGASVGQSLGTRERWQECLFRSRPVPATHIGLISRDTRACSGSCLREFRHAEN